MNADHASTAPADKRNPHGQFAPGNPGGPGNPHARRVAQLVNRQKERATSRRVCAQHAHHFARLSKIESIERLVEHEERLRGK